MTVPDDVRRDTPLARQLKKDIRQRGAISVRDYMARCLTDPVHGYYRHRNVVGRSGDFVTAPEISQIFGEMLGLWTATVWQLMGAPRPIRLVEIGPGRGTLMRDMLRAARVLPAFLDATDVHLVEISPRLRDLQRQTLKGVAPPVHWHEDCRGIPPGPTIALANELLDALPARQFVHHDGAWQERGVDIGPDGELRFTALVTDDRVPQALVDSDLPRSACEDAVVEITDFTSVLGQLLARAGGEPTSALLLDYGHDEPHAVGDTLQAVRNHAYEHPLTSPGEADLSMQVNFARVARQIAACTTDAAAAHPPAIDGPVSQAQFLGRLGIVERASRLMAANPRAAASIEMDVARLTAPNGMGGRFLAVGMRSPHLPTLPGLARIDSANRIT